MARWLNIKKLLTVLMVLVASCVGQLPENAGPARMKSAVIGTNELKPFKPAVEILSADTVHHLGTESFASWPPAVCDADGNLFYHVSSALAYDAVNFVKVDPSGRVTNFRLTAQDAKEFVFVSFSVTPDGN